MNDELLSTFHLLSNRIELLMEQLAERGVTVHIHWVPGHSGAEGNERADTVCSVVRKAVAPLIAKARQQRVWEVAVVSEKPSATSGRTSPGQLKSYRGKQLSSIEKWRSRPVSGQRKKLDLKMKAMEMKKKTRKKKANTRKKKADTRPNKPLPQSETLLPQEPSGQHRPDDAIRNSRVETHLQRITRASARAAQTVPQRRLPTGNALPPPGATIIDISD